MIGKNRECPGLVRKLHKLPTRFIIGLEQLHSSRHKEGYRKLANHHFFLHCARSIMGYTVGIKSVKHTCFPLLQLLNILLTQCISSSSCSLSFLGLCEWMQGSKVSYVWGPFYSRGATLIDGPVLGVQEQGMSDSRRFEALTVNPIVHTGKLPACMAALP